MVGRSRRMMEAENENEHHLLLSFSWSTSHLQPHSPLCSNTSLELDALLVSVCVRAARLRKEAAWYYSIEAPHFARGTVMASAAAAPSTSTSTSSVSAYPPKPLTLSSSGGPAASLDSNPPSPVAHSFHSATSTSSASATGVPAHGTSATPSGPSATASGSRRQGERSFLNKPDSLASSQSSASYDVDEDDDDDDQTSTALSANRAGRSAKEKHALFFSTSRQREHSGRSTPLARPSIEETQPLRPGSSLASRQLGSAPPFHSSTSKRERTMSGGPDPSMSRSTVKSLSGSSHAGEDDDHDEGIDEVELTPASPGRLSRTNSATAELQGALGFGGGASTPYAALPARTLQERRRAYWRSAALNLLLIASWYLFSTLISLYNKWMFDKKHYNFAYPLFVTSFHMVVQAILSSLALCIFQRQLVVRRPNGRRERPSFSDWGTKVVPCGIATALDVGLSNLSLKTITLTFYTMCKSSNLAFVLFFAFLFRLEKVRLSLIGIIALITIGVIMMVAAETQFVLVGAIEVLTASAMGGLRWALAQMLLEGRGKNSGMGMAGNPIATIFWLAPIMAVSMAVASMIVEDWRVVLTSRHFRGLAVSLKTLGLVTAPGVLAFCMHLSEFALIQRTSVVTLSVAGIFKEVSTIILASTIFGDELTPINVTGLCITILGIALYNWLKYRLNINAPTPAVEGVEGGGVGAYGGTGLASRGGYTQVFDRDVDGADEREPALGQSGTKSSATSRPAGGRAAEPEVISPEEAERRRKREEEADMDGWSTAGVVHTGNGYYE
ncbi:hypothetical protein V8E36_005974 [Tilletia maclaganii]